MSREKMPRSASSMMRAGVPSTWRSRLRLGRRVNAGGARRRQHVRTLGEYTARG
jgi:hypothetical protein